MGLRANLPGVPDKRMREAMDEVSKVATTGFYAWLPKALKKKLDVELARAGLKQREWLVAQIHKFIDEGK